MDRRVSHILKELGLWRIFIVVLILRSPFDFLNAVLGANMLERFIRLTQMNEREELIKTFWVFLLFTVLLFSYNATVWSTISIKADMLLHKRLRMRLFESMLKRSQQEMEAYSAGDWITRLNTDVDKTADYLTCPLNFMHASIAALNLILSSLVIGFLNVYMLAATLIVMIPFFIISGVVITRKIPQYRKSSQEAFAAFTNWVEPVVNAGDAIRLFEGEGIVREKIEKESLRIMHENMKAHRLTAVSSLVNVFSGNLGYVLLLFIGNSMMGKGIKDFAELTKITQYRGQMMQSVMCVNTCINRMKTNLTGAVRVDEIVGLDENGEKGYGERDGSETA